MLIRRIGAHLPDHLVGGRRCGPEPHQVPLRGAVRRVPVCVIIESVLAVESEPARAAEPGQAPALRASAIQLTAPAGPLNTQCKVYTNAVDADGAVYPDRKQGGISATVQVVEG
ncbi:hypothetical protein GCM10010399_86480 [Dactylosporangium fulvum]|uniref:Uncharacterized protein n=1 Tax=Dactylosporangium fulvum TaxID=53359 RepID=A0ABY5VWG8_9ACTN|nr:hypothetical protein [Dactylosporangium fulvum]UWP82148.1 hypothetical protein Dfulv_44980 [Dactylosporangium fulvum]